MTVKELKALLENEPDDKLIIVHGYEDEFDDIKEAKTIQIVPYGNKNIWYLGTHVEFYDEIDLKPGQKITDALLLT